MNETMVTITGNLISDVTMRRTADGVKVANFRMASNERRYDKAAEQWVDGDRLYVTVTCWRRLADGVVSSLVKGDPVIVTGRLYTRGYEVEGNKRSVTELDGYAVGPDLTRCFAELKRPRRVASEDAAPEIPEQVTAPVEAAAAAPGTESGERQLSVVGGASS